MFDLNSLFIDAIIRTNADAIDFVETDRVKNRECGELELDALECLEAYGARRGRKLCTTYIDDYKECMLNFIQVT